MLADTCINSPRRHACRLTAPSTAGTMYKRAGCAALKMFITRIVVASPTTYPAKALHGHDIMCHRTLSNEACYASFVQKMIDAHLKKYGLLGFCLASYLSTIATKIPGTTMSPNPSIENGALADARSSARGKRSFMGASNDLATVTFEEKHKTSANVIGSSSGATCKCRASDHYPP